MNAIRVTGDLELGERLTDLERAIKSLTSLNLVQKEVGATVVVS